MNYVDRSRGGGEVCPAGRTKNEGCLYGTPRHQKQTGRTLAGPARWGLQLVHVVAHAAGIGIRDGDEFRGQFIYPPTN